MVVLRKADAGSLVGEPRSLKVSPDRIIHFLELSPSVLGVGVNLSTN